jgi:hypothetical protein
MRCQPGRVDELLGVRVGDRSGDQQGAQHCLRAVYEEKHRTERV